MRTLLVTAVTLFVVDQIIKVYILFGVFDLPRALIGTDPANLPYPPVVEVFPPYLVLTMAWNKGINFGLFAGYDLRWVLIALALAISVGVVWWMRRETRWLAHLSAGFLVGGALGNVIDRILYGAVADFLNMSCCGIQNPYAFNVADISIFVGAIGLVLFSSDGKAGDGAAGTR